MIQAKRAYVKEAGPKRNWPKYAFLGLGIYLVWVLFGGVLEIRQAYVRIDEARIELASEETRRGQLARTLSVAKTREYIEKVARNDLNMQLPGETVVVLPDGGAVAAEMEKTEVEIPNFVKWWNLIK